MAAGQDEIDKLREAGFGDADIAQWKTQTSQDLAGGGYSNEEIDTYFGISQPDYSGIDKAFVEHRAREANISSTGEELPADEDLNAFQAFKRGFDGSISGMVLSQEAGKGIGQHEGIWDNVLFGVGEMVGDLPVSIPSFVLGAIPGAQVGALGGGVVAGPPGAVLGAVGGGATTGGAVSGFVTADTRTALMQFYQQNPDAQVDGGSFLTRMASLMLSEQALEAGKFEGTVGAVLGPLSTAGKPVGKAVAKTIKNPVGAVVAREVVMGTAEVGAAVATISAMTGEMPTKESFGQAAGMVFAFRAGNEAFGQIIKRTPGAKDRAAAVESIDAGLARTVDKGAIKIVEKNLRDHYAATGESPDQAVARSAQDAELRQWLITGHDRVSQSGVDMGKKTPDILDPSQTAEVVDNVTIHEADVDPKVWENVQAATTTDEKLLATAAPEVKVTEPLRTSVPSAEEVRIIQKFTEENINKMSQAEHAELAGFVGRSSLAEDTTLYRGTTAGKGKGTGVAAQGVVSTSRSAAIAKGFARINSDAKAGDGKVVPVQEIIIEKGASAADVSKLGTREAEAEVLISAADLDNAEVVGTKRVTEGGIEFEIETIRIKKQTKDLTLEQSQDLLRTERGLDVPGGGGQPPKVPGEGKAPGAPDEGPKVTKELRDLEADKKAIAAMVREEKRKRYWIDDFRFDFVNDLQHIVSEANKAWKSETGNKLNTEQNPGELARLAAGSHAEADMNINLGIFDPKTGKLISGSLKDALKKVGKSVEERQGFRDYLIAKRMVEKANQGFNVGENIAAARNVAKAGDKNKKFVEAANDIQHWQDSGVKVLVESGLLSKARAERMIELNKDYVPFFRLMYEDGKGPAGTAARGIPVRTVVKKFKGSDLPMADPLEVMVKNRYSLLQTARNNEARSRVVEFSKKLRPENQFVERVGEVRKPIDKITDLPIDEDIPSKQLRPAKEAPKGDHAKWLDENGMSPEDAPEFASFWQDSKTLRKDEFIVYEDGRAVKYRANNIDLVKSLQSMTQGEQNILIKYLAIPSSIMRTGTVTSPDFIIRATVRDNFSSVFLNSFKVVPIGDAVIGLSSIMKKDEHYIKWLANGGANSALLEMDKQILARTGMENIDPSFLQKSWNVAATPYRVLAYGSTMAENSMRLGQFKRSTKAGTDEMTAALRSRDVSLDFHRMGARVRSYNRISAFLGASINGIDRTRQSFQDNPKATFAKVTAGLTIPSIALYMANRDEEWHKNIPEWERASFWHFPVGPEFLENGERNPEFAVVKMPMPLVYGQAFGYMPVATLDAYLTDNPGKAGEIAENVLKSVEINVWPTAISPLVEIGDNVSRFTGRPIVSRAQESLLPQYRYNQYTTETAKAVAKVISQSGFAGAVPERFRTPIAVEHLVGAWAGSLGKTALAAVDEVLRKIGVVPDNVRPTRDYEDIPMVKSFFSRYPTASKQLGDFYDHVKEFDEVQNSIDALIKQGQVEEAQELIFEHGNMLAQTQPYKTAISNLTNVIRGVHYNTQMTADEKRQLIDDTLVLQNDMAKQFNEIFRQLREAE